MIFAKKEVHIVELHRIGAVAASQIIENLDCPFRRLHAFRPAIRSMHTTKAAIERASNAGVMHCGSLAKEGGPEVFLDRQTMEGRPGKIIRPLHGPLRVDAM